MKKIAALLTIKNTIAALTIILLFATQKGFAQNTWRFHIAFEDGIGAKDTIWMVWDSSATSGDDPLLGDSAYHNMDLNAFNVWMWNSIFDSTKTNALPFNVGQGGYFQAFNYQYPLIIRWDTALFHSAILPSPVLEATIDNDWFFSNNNHASLSMYDMLLDDTAYAPYFTFGSQSQFPMTFTISRTTTIGLDKTETINHFIAYPNPFSYEINLKNTVATFEKYAINIFSIDGKLIFKQENVELNNSYSIDLSFLEKGIYYLELNNKKNSHHEKIIKI